MENIEKDSEEKLHYESLLSFFKNLVSAISILTIVALALIGVSINSIKKDMETELASLKEQVVELENKIQNSINQTKQEADRQLSLLRNDASDIIGFTKEITQTQVKIISEDVKNLALSTARNRVEEAFQSQNISSLVENKAEIVVGNRLEKLVDRELENVKIAFEYIPKITTAFDQIRQGNRKYFDELDTLAHFSEYEIVREIARELILQKGKDYIESIEMVPLMFGKSTVKREGSLYEFMRIDPNFVENSTPILMVRAMIDTIGKSQDLHNVAAAFLVINEELGIDIKPFDMQVYRDLAKKYNSN